MNYTQRKEAFTLVELMVVITIIILVTGMTVPMMMSFFEKEKLPRAAKILATQMRSAQIISMNYNTKTFFELVPGTDNTLRTWSFAGLCTWPDRDDGDDWDKGTYIMITEARRVPRSGGTIRPVPINRYSREPVNCEGSMTMSMDLNIPPGLSSSHWEYGELSYQFFGIVDYRNAPGGNPWWGMYRGVKSAGAFQEIKFSNGVLRAAGHQVKVYSPYEVQVLQGGEKFLPKGVGIDPVNYVSYRDTDGDGMADGNPLAMTRLKTAVGNNTVEPIYIPIKGGVALDGDLYKDASKFIPKLISATVAFSKEGTLRKNLSLHYYSQNPVASGEYFTTTVGNIENVHYGFIVYDKANPTASRMMVEVTGAGQIRVPYGVYPAKKKKWGENFDVKTQYGR